MPNLPMPAGQGKISDRVRGFQRAVGADRKRRGPRDDGWRYFTADDGPQIRWKDGVWQSESERGSWQKIEDQETISDLNSLLERDQERDQETGDNETVLGGRQDQLAQGPDDTVLGGRRRGEQSQAVPAGEQFGVEDEASKRRVEQQLGVRLAWSQEQATWTDLQGNRVLYDPAARRYFLENQQ